MNDAWVRETDGGRKRRECRDTDEERERRELE